MRVPVLGFKIGTYFCFSPYAQCFCSKNLFL